jgi:hypothetical protein
LVENVTPTPDEVELPKLRELLKRAVNEHEVRLAMGSSWVKSVTDALDDYFQREAIW